MSVDKGRAVDVSHLHFCKAFDFTVPYNILLCTLEEMDSMDGRSGG